MKEISYIAKLEGSLRLSSEGEWVHNGAPFQNQNLAEFFSRSIVWDEAENRYFVQIGTQRATFDIDDTPYFVMALDDSTIPWRVHISDGSQENLQADTLSSSNDGRTYCMIKFGAHRAKFLRAAHQRLARHVISDSEILIGDKRVSLK